MGSLSSIEISYDPLNFQKAKIAFNSATADYTVAEGDLVIYNSTTTACRVFAVTTDNTTFVGVSMTYKQLDSGESEDIMVALECIIKAEVDAAHHPGAVLKYKSGANGTKWVFDDGDADTIAWAYERTAADANHLIKIDVPLLPMSSLTTDSWLWERPLI